MRYELSDYEWTAIKPDAAEQTGGSHYLDLLLTSRPFRRTFANIPTGRGPASTAQIHVL